MSYKMANGRMARTEESALGIASGETESADLELGDARVARVVATVALEGTDPGATLTIRGRQLQSDGWTTLATATSLVDGDVVRKAVMPMRFLGLLIAYAGEDGGDVGDVSQTTGAGPGFTISGTPLVDGTLTVTISTGGANGTGKFDWELGELSAADVTIPTTPFTAVLAGTGLTLTFEDDTFVEGDEFEAVITASVEDTTGTVVCQIEVAR